MGEPYPPPAFRFDVRVIGVGAVASALTVSDASFAEVSGLQAEFGVEEVVEGGENRFVHRLPRPARYSNLVLKRGVVLGTSFLAEWVGATVGARMALPVVTQNLLVTLLNENGHPTIAWAVVNAFPLKWDVGPLNSTDNKVLMETLEFSYNYFERVNLGSAASVAVRVAQLAASLA